ncbi:MAG TPA: radical SAM family heme chaperone HemW [Candidatus Binatia bacterium]|nr:radical SAM family heme chaperone HemW [Candidatus Binatia bacterium]
MEGAELLRAGLAPAGDTCSAGGPADPPPGAPRSLYLHIPFCERRCEYCDFVSMPGRDGEAEYLERLRCEIRQLATRVGRLELDTVFVGGGTPSFVDPHRLGEVLDEVRAGFDLAADCEVTLEANPSSTTRARAREWLEAGFNRVSLGIQSLEPDILAFLGRVHDPSRAIAAVGEVRRAGFRRVSCDLIYAVPGLDDARWRSTLEGVVRLGPGHVSAYELTVEAGTPLHARVRRGASPAVDPEAALRQHRIAVEVLGSAGLRQYEVSNFAVPGEECRHNVGYWRRGHYLAAGLGAHAHLPVGLAPALGFEAPAGAVSVRAWHGRSLPGYLRVGGDRLAFAGWEPVDASQAEAERVMLGLRLSDGVTLAGSRLVRAAPLVRSELLWNAAGRFGATERGQEVLDELIRQLA